MGDETNLNNESRAELAAAAALGALDGPDAQKLAELQKADAEVRREIASYSSVIEGLAKSVPAGAGPSPELKSRILQQAEKIKTRSAAAARIKQLLPAGNALGFSFLRAASGTGWLPLPVPGASVKMLSFDDSTGYAVVLGKLEAGARYPSHTHKQSEDIFMISGDLHIGEEVIRAGDFHHAAAGSTHGVNWSEGGCVLLAVLSKEDLMAQMTG